MSPCELHQSIHLRISDGPWRSQPTDDRLENGYLRSELGPLGIDGVSFRKQMERDRRQRDGIDEMRQVLRYRHLLFIFGGVVGVTGD